MQSKGLLSLIMMVTIGTMSVSARHTLDLDSADHAMEEPAHAMDAAAEREFLVKAMASSKHLSVLVILRIMSNMLHSCPT
jgi:hypothetical protein